MKRICMITTVLLFLLTGCGQPDGDSMLDLSAMNKTMQYSQLCQMLDDPDSYLDQTVQLTGEYYADGTEPVLLRVLDEQGCCAAEIEFFAADMTDFDGTVNFSEVTVRGRFGTYTQSGMDYCCLYDAEPA